jgi:hypothetical protein
MNRRDKKLRARLALPPKRQLLLGSNTQTIRNRQQVTTRNSLCPCGSGKKFKACCHRQRPGRINPYQSFQVASTAYMQAQERRFARQWGIVPPPPILAAYCEGDHQRVRDWIEDKLTKAGCKPAFVRGVLALNRLATPLNTRSGHGVQPWTEEESRAYTAELSEYCPPTEEPHDAHSNVGAEVSGPGVGSAAAVEPAVPG